MVIRYSITVGTLLIQFWSHIYNKSMDQPGKVASPAHGQLNMENEYLFVRVVGA